MTQRKFAPAGNDLTEHGIPGCLRPSDTTRDFGMKVLEAAKGHRIRVLAIDESQLDVALSPIDQGAETLAQVLAYAGLASREIAACGQSYAGTVKPIEAGYSKR